MIRLIAVILLLIPALASPAAADSGPDQKAVEAAGFAAGDVGFVLLDPVSGRVLAEQFADSQFMPASVAKLATVYAATRILGPDFRFPTRLYRSGGTLYLKGGGDPVLTNLELRTLASQAKGNWNRFIYDASSIAEEIEVNGDQPIGAVYNAGFGALNVDFNRIQVNWARDPDDGHLALKTRAIADGLNVPADWVTYAPVQADPPPGANFLYAGDESGERWLYARDLAESLPDDGAIFLPVKHPAANTAQVFRQIAADAGVDLPAPVAGSVPPDAALVAEVESPPLSVIIPGLLKFSNNMTAELIGMAASQRLTGHVLNRTASSAALADWLATQLPEVDWKGFHLVNSSGLSTENRVTPRQIAALLAAIGREPGLAAALSPLGMADPGAKAVAKTGTMDFACGLGGFFTAQSGTHLAFAIFAIDRDRRAKLDASFDRRVLAPTPGARNWIGRAHALESRLLERWRTDF